METPKAQFTLSAFGDEICDDLAEQLQVLVGLDIHRLDLRGAWGKNVAFMEEEDITRVQQVCGEYGVKVNCLGSPVGKSPLVKPLDYEQANLTRLMATGIRLDTHLIRIFSFYPEDISTNQHYDQYVPEVIDRLGVLAAMAQREGFILLLENEKDIVTDTPERCVAVLEGVNSPALGFAWDSANFVQVGVAQPVSCGWDGLAPYLRYVHVKDALLADGKVTPAGKGDGQVADYLQRLKGMGYQGTLCLEPHLQIAGHSSGYSGPEGMALAARALRELMAEVGCEEAR